jgi:hypothetical protein
MTINPSQSIQKPSPGAPGLRHQPLRLPQPPAFALAFPKGGYYDAFQVMRLPLFGAALMLILLAGCAGHQSAGTKAGPAAKTSAEYNSRYNKPLTSLGAKYSQLTAAAQTTLLAEAGSADIYDVVKHAEGGRVYFVVYFTEVTQLPPLYIAADGSVLRPDLSVAIAAPKEESSTGGGTPINITDVPSNVQKVLLEHSKNGEVTTISKEAWGDRMVYVFSFKDEENHPKLYVIGDGTVTYLAPK